MTTNPSQELRTAAAKLRALATAATPGPWAQAGIGDFGWGVDGPSAETPDSDQGRADASFIATMHPGVGAAIADWLDCWVGIDFSEHAAMPGDLANALCVARQINTGGTP
ncbi:hypothetical protein [Streptomyces sp. NPDC058653]|uniref:hypothetical protein n=1 Tax=Streptomyces sp. NPDC058653 TaxID=3346576 RepID=UPI0036464DEE